MKINKKHVPFFFLGVMCLIFFVFFSVLIKVRLLTYFDVQATQFLQRLIPLKIDAILSILSLIGSFEVTSVFLFVVLLLRKKIREIFIPFIFFIGAHVIEIIEKTYLYHPGPPKEFFRYDIDFLFPSAYVQPGSSYPSGHSLRIVFLAIMLGYFIYHALHLNRTKRYFGFVLIGCLTLFMLFSRISLGEHWASDVIGGAVFGASMAFFTLVFF